MKGICRLCDNYSQLKESHVIPIFVFKWLKSSSGSGFLRFGETINKRAQDGLKYYWLCKDCEGIFSEWEREFANNLFHPTVNGKFNKTIYSEWLLKFCVSVSWRVLELYLQESKLENFSKDLKAKAKQTYQVWKEFLLGKRPHPGKHEQHILPLDAVENHTLGKIPININRYILRSVDTDAVAGENRAFVYSKLERIIIIGFIEMPNPHQWDGTKVHVKNGSIGPRHYTLPIEFGDYFIGQANKALNIQKKISEKQNKKIEQSFRKNIDTLADTETIRALKQDMRLAGKSTKNP
jgi:hypothetical protein